jgi:Spy/CpxP family protein refolding chaperone
MKRMWIVTIGVGAALLISALAWAGSRPDDPDDDDNGGSVWMSQRQPSGMMGRRGFAGTRGGLLARRQELLEDLDLSRDQAKEIAEIRDEQRRRAIDRRAEIQVAALDLRKLMRANRPDRGAIEHQIDVIAHLRAELHKSRVDALLDMREVLTPEQREKLKEHWLGIDSD